MSDALKMFQPKKPEPPKQWLPGFIRWPLRIIAYPFMMADVLSHKLVLFIFKPRYKIEGECKKRGDCCQFIHMSWPTKKKKQLSMLTKLYLFWQTQVLGFYFRDFDFIEEGELTRVMSCRHLSDKGVCNHYRLRPGICRNWPKKHPVNRPHVLKGCGFTPVLRVKKKRKFIF